MRAPGVDLGGRRDVQVLVAELVGDARVHLPLEDVEVRLQVAVRRADVAPVPVVHVAVQRAGRRELGEHAALDGEQPAARDHLQHLGLEHVDAGVDERRALPLPGLLEEAGDGAVLAQFHETVAPRVLHRREEDGAHAALGRVRGGERAEVDVAEHVAVEDVEAAVVEQRVAVGDGAGGAERLVLDGVVDLESVAGAVADDRLDGLGEKAGGEDRALHAVTGEVVEDVGDERPLDDRRDRLGHARGDGTQPRALAADEDDGLPRDASRRAHAGLRGRRARGPRRPGRCPRTRCPPRRRRRGRRSCGRR